MLQGSTKPYSDVIKAGKVTELLEQSTFAKRFLSSKLCESIQSALDLLPPSLINNQSERPSVNKTSHDVLDQLTPDVEQS